MQKLISAIQGLLPKKKEWKDHLTNDKLIREYQGHNKCLTSCHSAIANGIQGDVEDRIRLIITEFTGLDSVKDRLAIKLTEALPSIIVKEAKE